MMKKILLAALVAIGLMARPAQADSLTSRMQLIQPSTGSLNWGGKTNYNFAVTDSSAAAQYQTNTFTASNTATGPWLLSNSSMTFTGAKGWVLTSSSMTAQGIFGNSIDLTQGGAGAFILINSSVNASSFFGDGSHLGGINGVLSNGVANTVGRWSGATTMVPSTLSDTSTGTTVTTALSILAQSTITTSYNATTSLCPYGGVFVESVTVTSGMFQVDFSSNGFYYGKKHFIYGVLGTTSTTGGQAGWVDMWANNWTGSLTSGYGITTLSSNGGATTIGSVNTFSFPVIGNHSTVDTAVISGTFTFHGELTAISSSTWMADFWHTMPGNSDTNSCTAGNWCLDHTFGPINLSIPGSGRADLNRLSFATGSQAPQTAAPSKLLPLCNSVQPGFQCYIVHCVEGFQRGGY